MSSTTTSPHLLPTTASWAGWLLAAFVLISPAAADAASTLVTNSPTAWRLENYPGSSVALYFTSSPCVSGQITFPANATAGDLNRLWATVTVAKTTGRKMFVFYDNANAPAVCPIISFGLDFE